MRLRTGTFCLLTLALLLTLSFASRLGFVYGAAPTATTLSPTNITATSATLRGSVNPNGKSTIVDFASALPSGNPGYFFPAPSPAQNIGSGSAPVIVTYTLTGLHPSTEYRYVVRASNADGGQNGATVIFHTLPAVVSTDWAVVSVGINPFSPSVGAGVTLWMKVRSLSTNGGYPQNIGAQCTIDGIACGSGVVTYPGPTGVEFTVTAATLWIATAGTHTLTWQVSTANDPNLGNNYGSFTFSIAAPFDFDVAAFPSSLTSQPGQTQTVQVNVNLKSGTPQPVTLTVSGQPAGVTASLNPTSANPTFTSTLIIVVSDTASAGSYSLSVTASGGGQTHSSTIMISISQAADFRIDASPASQSVAQGQTASYSVNVVGSNGFNSQVYLSISGLPSGAIGVFTVNSGTPDFSATLTVTLPSDAPAGSFTLMIKGAGGGLERTVNVVLTITAVTTQTTAQTQTTTQTGPSPTGDMLELLQRNSLLIIDALIVLVILFGALAMRSRSRQTVPQQAAAPRNFCGKCGTENPTSNEFCGNCGNRLKST